MGRSSDDIVYVFMPLEGVLCFNSSTPSLCVDEDSIVKASKKAFQDWDVDITSRMRLNKLRSIYNFNIIVTSQWFGRFGLDYLRQYLKENKFNPEVSGILRPQFDVYFADERDRKVYEIQTYIEKYKEHIKRWIIIDTESLKPYLAEHYHDRFVKIAKAGLRRKASINQIDRALHNALIK